MEKKSRRIPPNPVIETDEELFFQMGDMHGENPPNIKPSPPIKPPLSPITPATKVGVVAGNNGKG